MDDVKKVIDDWDPIDLLPYAPNDEYSSEIAEIENMLRLCNNAVELSSGIYKVFLKAFGEDVFKRPEYECYQIAERLLSGRTKAMP